MAPSDEMRLDELAREAGVATTTVRLYQNKGLLPGPRLVGRTGYYDESHLVRLALIGRLQAEGFSLSAIGRLLEAWEQGRNLDDLVGVERGLGSLVAAQREVVVDADELAAHLPPDSLDPEVMERATTLGLIEPTEDGRFRLPDRRILDTGSALVRLGVPPSVVLDEWSRLAETTDGIADRFIGVFEDHLLPADWRRDLTSTRAADLARALDVLRDTARQVLLAALDASLARRGAQRLGELVEIVAAAEASGEPHNEDPPSGAT